MTRRALLLFLLSLTWLAWAQTTCEFCKSNVEVKPVNYRDGEHYLCIKCRKLPPCAICHQPSPGKPYRDGRNLCPICRKTGLFDKKRAEVLAKQVVNFMIAELGPEAKTLPPVELVDYDEIQTRHNESGQSAEVLAFYRAYNPEIVYLLSGESEAISAATLAHELTHAWQSRACPPQDKALKEGFACWVQYQYLLAQGLPQEADKLTRHSHPDYGPPLVKLLARARSLGKPAFLKAVIKAKKLSDV